MRIIFHGANKREKKEIHLRSKSYCGFSRHRDPDEEALSRVPTLTSNCTLFVILADQDSAGLTTTPGLHGPRLFPSQALWVYSAPQKPNPLGFHPLLGINPHPPNPPNCGLCCFTIKMPPTRPTGFACTTCGREYQHSSHLRRHEATRTFVHSEKTPSRCLPGVTALSPADNGIG